MLAPVRATGTLPAPRRLRVRIAQPQYASAEPDKRQEPPSYLLAKVQGGHHSTHKRSIELAIQARENMDRTIQTSPKTPAHPGLGEMCICRDRCSGCPCSTSVAHLYS